MAPARQNMTLCQGDIHAETFDGGSPITTEQPVVQRLKEFLISPLDVVNGVFKNHQRELGSKIKF